MRRSRSLEWQDRAACVNCDPEDFQAEYPSSGAMTSTVLASKSVCARCPVRPDCLYWAMGIEDQQQLAWQSEEQFRPKSLDEPITGCRTGIFGGFTGSEREAIAKRADRFPRLEALWHMQLMTYPELRMKEAVA